ncbi:nitroreductase [Blastocystis sp. subtype 4]|uniref:nitroreductase n=1 Tax=Blastocystis sp. subtype 4 TaxID=944170 RepID=UPI000711B097|nr:nitroreductase [Blastocystis sp. subtype 4]KNB45102.1 nitroreductase [Blastocystis sp. subtype 4]|eukprot:XP_014528545.1 nitroreductase [Blastocystis sp. subtype 4]
MDFDILKTVVISRQSIREFSNKQIAPGVLETILGYSLRTPTSMNLQPYRMILVRDSSIKEKLANCMSQKNAPVVREADVSIIMCSEMGMVLETPKSVFQTLATSSKYTLNTLIHVMFGWIYDVFAFFIRLFRPFSSRITMQAWSQQQVAFLIENICLLAESSGLNSVIMNGYSEAKVQEAFKIPYNFQVSAVIALGYKKEECNPRRKGRFPFGKLFVDVIIDRICSI